MIIHRIQNEQKYNKEQRTAFLDFSECGFIHAQANWKHKKRFLEKYELIFVSEGILYLKIGDEDITLKENDLIIVPPYKVICGNKVSDVETSFYWVDFDTDDPSCFGIILDLIHIRHSEKFTSLLEDLINLSHHSYSKDFVKDSYLMLLLHLINKNIEEQSTKHVIINKVINYVDANLSIPITVEMVANALKYNKDYISRIVKNYFGVSLKGYIDQQKMNFAKKLLVTSNYSIKDIAFMLGFQDSNLFTKFFKYNEKISPLQYRNMHGLR